MDQFYEISQKFLVARNQVYRRYFICNQRLAERFSILIGQRGVGKTTLLIQYLLDYAKGDFFSPKILYVPSDNLALGNASLYAIAEQFELNGGEFIAFDEIHKAVNWSAELKSISDSFPKLKILASGSSALEIHKGSHDLSRRAIVYRVQGMSFREYLELMTRLSFSAISLEELLVNHQMVAHSIISRLEEKVNLHFKNYLRHGFYPYWFELNEEVKFEITLEQNVHATLEGFVAQLAPSSIAA